MQQLQFAVRQGGQCPVLSLGRRTLVAYAAVIVCTLGGLAHSAEHPTAERGEVARKRVLLVHSYHRGYPWVDAITRGVRMAFSRSNIDLEVFCMDTKRHTGETWKRQRGERAAQIVAEWQPDVVIAADDIAQAYFARQYVGRLSPQVVFCGVNADPVVYGYPADNVSGVLERPHFAASLELLRRLMPSARRVALVSDGSETSVGALASMQRETTDFTIVSVRTPSTFEQWKEAISQAQHDADAIGVYQYHTVRQPGRETSIDSKEVMDWTVEHSRLPIVGFFIFAVDDGALCGCVESGVEHGFKAGQMAAEILRGKTARDIPVVTALETQSMLNLKAARRLGIDVPQELAETIDLVIGE